MTHTIDGGDLVNGGHIPVSAEENRPLGLVELPQKPVDDGDDMLDAAIECVIEMGMASTSMLQRKLKLGYARAARIIDQMEERGIVGPFEGSKPRQVLISKEQWLEKQLQSDE